MGAGHLAGRAWARDCVHTRGKGGRVCSRSSSTAPYLEASVMDSTASTIPTPQGQCPFHRSPNPEMTSSLRLSWVQVPAPALPSWVSSHFLSLRLGFLLCKVGDFCGTCLRFVKGKQGNAFRGA